MYLNLPGSCAGNGGCARRQQGPSADRWPGMFIVARLHAFVVALTATFGYKTSLPSAKYFVYIFVFPSPGGLDLITPKKI